MTYKMSTYTIKFDIKFTHSLKKLDNSYKIQIKKQIKKISQNPLIGKPMRNTRKGTREVYLKPFRISYEFKENELTIIFLEIYHKDNQ